MITRRSTSFAAALVVLGLALAGCGSSDSSDQDRGDPIDASTTTDETRSTTTTTTDEGPFVSGATVFEDPDGTYVMDVDPAWTEGNGPTSEIEVWFIGSGNGQFNDNVNVLTQDTQGMDLQEYLDYSAENLGGLELVSSEVITGEAGNQIGLIEYQGTLPSAAIPLHVLATVIVEDGQAALATLTTTMETFDAAQVAVEPYLRTLRPFSQTS